MAYTPQFNRPVQGNYSEQKAYMSLVMGSQANIMDDEFNEMQWLATYQRSRLLSEIHSSGFFAKGTDSVTASAVTLAQRDLMLSGHLLHMIGQAANSGNVIVSLPAPPSTGTRTDLVYLVMYLTEINYNSGAIYKYGYQQGDTLTNDMLDGRAPGETTRRIQKQWTVKVAQAVSTITDASLGYTATSYDPNLYTKANGSTADSLEYAIPLYQVNRSAGDSPVPTLTDVAFYIRTIKNAGQAGGYATLDPTTGKVGSSQLPSDLVKADATNSFTAAQAFAATLAATASNNYGSQALQFQRSTWNGTAAVTGTSSLQLDNAGKLNFFNEGGTSVWNVDQTGSVTYPNGVGLKSAAGAQFKTGAAGGTWTATAASSANTAFSANAFDGTAVFVAGNGTDYKGVSTTNNTLDDGVTGAATFAGKVTFNGGVAGIPTYNPLTSPNAWIG